MHELDTSGTLATDLVRGDHVAEQSRSNRGLMRETAGLMTRDFHCFDGPLHKEWHICLLRIYTPGIAQKQIPLNAHLDFAC